MSLRFRSFLLAISLLTGHKGLATELFDIPVSDGSVLVLGDHEARIKQSHQTELIASFASEVGGFCQEQNRLLKEQNRPYCQKEFCVMESWTQEDGAALSIKLKYGNLNSSDGYRLEFLISYDPATVKSQVMCIHPLLSQPVRELRQALALSFVVYGDS
ncbi:MAG: hypothetical protein HRU19_16390 [Pseudobacteriovorax sp.]|nr:hypothetical protein [Pseudobacteriovorax sp.]